MKILTNISSGLNENRSGLKQIIKLVEGEDVGKLVITYHGSSHAFASNILNYFDLYGELKLRIFLKINEFQKK